MPEWTLAQLCSQTTTALGNRSDLALSTVSFWVNEAENEIWSQLPESQQEALAISSTTVNEDKISYPSDFLELIALSNLSDDRSLLDPLNADQVVGWSNYSGMPTHYAEYATWIELRPIPDSAYSLELRYRKQRSDMTATTAIPSIATRYRRGIMLKAKALLARHVVLDPVMAATADNEYLSFMGSLPNDRALRVRDQHAIGCSLGRYRGQKTQASTQSFDRDYWP